MILLFTLLQCTLQHLMIDQTQLILQNLHEEFYFDLPDNYTNATYSVINIEADNEYTKLFPLPNITLYEPLRLASQFSIEESEQFCPIQTWGPNKQPYSFFLSPTNLRVGSEQGSSQTYFFKDITQLENINCTHMSMNPYVENSVYLDCYTPEKFINISATLVLKSYQIEFYWEEYLFNDELFTDYWKTCIRKEIAFIQVKYGLERLFTCKIAYNTQEFWEKFSDSIIAISHYTKEPNEGEPRQFTILSLSRQNFTDCNKHTQSSFPNPFFVEDITIKDISKMKLTYSTTYVMDFAILISNRSGICKCNYEFESLQCSFLELQDSNFTRLSYMVSADNQMYFFVSSTQFVFRVNIQDNWKTNQDLTDGYFRIGEPGYNVINIQSSLYFLLIQLSPYDQEQQFITYENIFTLNCIYQLPTPRDEFQMIYKLFQQKNSKGNTFKPALIISKPADTPLFQLQNFNKLGDFICQWDSYTKELSLFQMSLKEGKIIYNTPIPESTFLLFNVDTQVQYLNESGNQDTDVFSFYVGIVPYNDTELQVVSEFTSVQFTFSDHQFSFDIQDGLVGPEKLYHQIKWKGPTFQDSEIQFTKNIRIKQVPDNLKKVFYVQVSYSLQNDPILKLIASYEKNGNESIGSWTYNYTIDSRDKKSDTWSGLFLNPELLYEYQHLPSLKNLDLFQISPISIIMGDFATMELYLCYIQILNYCGKFEGDIMEQPYGVSYLKAFEKQCKDDIMITISKDKKSIVWYTHGCPNIFINKTIHTSLMGRINSSMIPELEQEEVQIVDQYFDIFQYQLNLILLSTGKIIIMANYQTSGGYQLYFDLTNSIEETECTPSSYGQSRIFIIEDEGFNRLIYVCYDYDNPIIYEYYITYTYQIINVRKLPLYQYDLLPQEINGFKAPLFTDQKLIYIPAKDKKTQQVYYLVYDPSQYSPNVLLSNIFMQQQDPLIKGVPLSIQANKVYVTGIFGSQEIFSLAFFSSGNQSGLFYTHYKPSYYGKVSVGDTVENMLMIYQKTTDNVIFKPFIVNFNFSDSNININQSLIQCEGSEDLDIDKFIIPTEFFGIEGPVQDYSITFTEQALTIRKLDFLTLTKNLATSYDAIKYGYPIDIVHLGLHQFQSLVSDQNIDEMNILFIITPKYLVVVEKTYSCGQNLTCFWRILSYYPLNSYVRTTQSVADCKISYSAIDQIIIYCYNPEISMVSNSLSALLNYTYIKKKLKFQINIGARVLVNQIQAIKINDQVFQILKFNYESAPEQQEILIGNINMEQFCEIQKIQSSNIDPTVLGPLYFDSQVIPETNNFIIVIAEPESLLIRAYGLDQKFNIKYEQKYSFQELNDTAYRSSEHELIQFVMFVSVNPQSKSATLLIGTQYSYYMLICQYGTKEIQIERAFKKYFQCKNALFEQPTLINQEMFAVTCIGKPENPDLFIDLNLYSKDQNLVYVQYFSDDDQSITQWPKRVLEVINSKKEQIFFIVPVLVNGEPYLVMENGTHFLQVYQVREKMNFDIRVPSQTFTETVIKGQIKFYNDYTVQTANVYLIREKYPHHSFLLWSLILAGIIIFFLTIMIIFTLYVCNHRNRQKQLSLSKISDSSETQNQKKKGNLGLLDEAIMQELITSKIPSRGFSNSKLLSDSLGEEYKWKLSPQRKVDNSQNSDDSD